MWCRTIDVIVAFDRAMYEVDEGDTSVQVCARIVDGSLASDRGVEVTLESMDDTATGNQRDNNT